MASPATSRMLAARRGWWRRADARRTIALSSFRRAPHDRLILTQAPVAPSPETQSIHESTYPHSGASRGGASGASGACAASKAAAKRQPGRPPGGLPRRLTLHGGF